jgi:hypothetical protein
MGGLSASPCTVYRWDAPEEEVACAQSVSERHVMEWYRSRDRVYPKHRLLASPVV